MMRCIHSRRTSGSGQLEMIAASLRGIARWYAKPIGHPALKLAGRQPALVHELMERVVGVVRGAERPEPGRPGPRPSAAGPAAESAAVAERRALRRSMLPSCRQTSKLMPSEPTAKPARSTVARSGEPSSSIGLVLLMWV